MIIPISVQKIIVFIKEAVRKLLGFKSRPMEVFSSYRYQRHNRRRLEHLASLGLPIACSTVLEVGAGIGDHTSFFLDRGCQVISTEARPENIEILHSRYPHIQVRHLDLDNPDHKIDQLFDIVYCYGVLYHLRKPDEAIEFMSHRCKKMLLLETNVSFGEGESIHHYAESAKDPRQSISGHACRPTRKWVYNQLRRHFDFVYMPITQPNHEEFPVDWTTPLFRRYVPRAIFISSRQKLINGLLLEGIPSRQSKP